MTFKVICQLQAFEMRFFFVFAKVDKTSTDLEHHAVLLRQMSDIFFLRLFDVKYITVI